MLGESAVGSVACSEADTGDAGSVEDSGSVVLAAFAEPAVVGDVDFAVLAELVGSAAEYTGLAAGDFGPAEEAGSVVLAGNVGFAVVEDAGFAAAEDVDFAVLAVAAGPVAVVCTGSAAAAVAAAECTGPAVGDVGSAEDAGSAVLVEDAEFVAAEDVDFAGLAEPAEPAGPDAVVCTGSAAEGIEGSMQHRLATAAEQNDSSGLAAAGEFEAVADGLS